MTIYSYDDVGTLYGTATYDSASSSTADGAPRVELLLNGVWTTITQYVRVEQGITIRRGRQDELSGPVPATCSMTLDNADGRFTPSYTSGAYYPYVIRNTQVRVSVYQSGAPTVRFWGEVSNWPVTFDHTGRNVTVDIMGSGYRKKLQRNAVPVGSAYKIAELSVTPLLGYWPMEDADGATSFGSALAGGVAGTFSGGGTLANDTTMIASDPLPTFTGTGKANFVVPAYTPSGTGQQIRWLQCKTTDSTTLKTFNCIVDTSGAHYFQYVYQPSTDTEVLYMINYASGAVEATNGPFTHGLAVQTTGCRMSIELKQNGTGIDCNVVELPVGSATGTGFGVVTIPASTLGRVTGVRYFANDPAVAYTVGHVSAENQISTIYDLGGLVGPLNAYAGEKADDRATRIGTYAGFSALVTTGPYAEQMGPQAMGTTLELWDDAAYVDGGLSTESVTGFALQWRGRSAMYDLASTPVFQLSRSEGITQNTDDQTTQNDVTVSRTGGSSARVVATTGLTPALVGTYAAAYDLNIYNDLQCSDQASWRMTIGSLDRPRYPSLQFDALNNYTSGLRDDIIAMREGFTVGLTAVGAEYVGINSPVSLRVLGWTETVADNQWLFDVNLGPGQPWNEIMVLDSATLGVLDTNRLGL